MLEDSGSNRSQLGLNLFWHRVTYLLCLDFRESWNDFILAAVITMDSVWFNGNKVIHREIMPEVADLLKNVWRRYEDHKWRGGCLRA